MNERTGRDRLPSTRSDLDIRMPGDGMGLDPDLDRDFTPDEARRALRGGDQDAVTPASNLGIDTSADVQANSGGNGGSTDQT